MRYNFFFTIKMKLHFLKKKLCLFLNFKKVFLQFICYNYEINNLLKYKQEILSCSITNELIFTLAKQACEQKITFCNVN